MQGLFGIVYEITSPFFAKRTCHCEESATKPSRGVQRRAGPSEIASSRTPRNDMFVLQRMGKLFHTRSQKAPAPHNDMFIPHIKRAFLNRKMFVTPKKKRLFIYIKLTNVNFSSKNFRQGQAPAPPKKITKCLKSPNNQCQERTTRT